MKRLLFLVLALFLWNGNSWGQSAIIGTGTSTTNGSSADPIERYYNYEHFQIVYTATELTAAGMPPNVTITSMGFSVSESAVSLANFSVDLGHTTQATADPYISTGLTNVVSAFTYTPVVQTAGNFDMISFTSNFAWDGSSNIVVNTCTGSNPYTTPYGGLRYTSSTSGSMRYIRTDGGSGNCETATNTSSSYKPNVRFDYVSTLPALFASPPTLDFGFVSSGSTSAEQIYTLSGVNLTAGPIVVTAPAGFGVSLTTGGPYISSVNVTYTPPTLASTTIYVQFSPTAPNTNYTGIITNIGGGSKASADVAVSGASPQDPASVPYSTDFEEPLGMSDWTLVNGTEINAWYIGVATAYSPSQSVFVSNDNGTNNAYSINSSSVVHFYRDIDFPAGTNPVDLEFYWKGYGESIYDYLRVYLVELDDFPEAGTLLTSGQIGSTYYNQQNDWIVENITLDPLVNGTSKRLVFSWRNDGSGGTTPPAAIDDVGLSTISCPEPTTLPETNITLNSADLSWTETGTATTWLYEYGISPYTFTGIGTSITSTTVTISGLNPDETYDWAVQADCDGGSFSNWVYTGQFTTHDGKAANPVPANGALNLLITSKTFDWDDVPGADSYIIDIGTETGLADIISGDACPTSTYTYTGSDWDYFEDYFWTVTTVYTAKAEIIGDEWDFTTECFPLSAPFSEFFDGVTAPDMPDCWSRIVNSTSTNAYVNTSTFNVPVSSPYHIVMSNFEDADADLLLVSPRLGDLNTQLNRIRFWAMGGDYYMLIGTMSDPTDESTFTHFETVFLPIFYEEFAVEFDASYTGSDEFIAFKHAQGEINKSTFIDNFHYEPIPTGPPPCASPISPWDGEPDVPVDGTLEWSPVFDATGYKIYFGTDGGGTSDPTSIANEVDLGDVTSYTYSGLDFSMDHYWKIVPYNDNGDQTGCGIWSFTTQGPPPPGDNCYDAIDLSLETSPYNSSTTLLNNDFSVCVMGSSNDFICFYDVEYGATIEIWQSDNNYDSRHTMRYGGVCPGDNQIDCIDDSDYDPITWTNTTGITERVWFIIGGYSSNSGDFTIEWNYTAPPACIAPTNQTESNETTNGADLGWDYPIDSFFDVFVDIDIPGPPTAGTPPTISGVPGNSVTWDGGLPNTTYNWWVRTNCGFTENAKVDYFWMAMPEPLMLEPGLSGGSSELIDPGEDFVWREYFDPNTGFAWWNIWFYNDPYIEENVKLIRMGFWIQTIDAGFDGNLAYVVNWSNGLWTIPEQYPMPPDEFAIERSPLNGNFVIPSGAPQWFELTYLIEDYNPEWVSVDIAGDNIQILEFSLDPPPADSPLFKWWQPGSPGGIIVHECLPANLGDNNSEWTGPGNFTTLALPPANDLCANAEVVTCGNTYPGTTTAATWDDVGECGTTNTQPGVWYVFTGPGGMVSADLCNGTTIWDSKISVFEGSCGALVCVDGNDDYCNYQSRLDWYAENGVDYYILVHQFGTSGGAFDLTIDCTDPATAIWQGDDYPDYYDWFGADNWDVQDVPGAGTDVSIPAGLTYYPTIDREARCNNLTIGSDASGTATILDNAYLAMYGTGTVDLYFTGDPTGTQDWHLVSSPITTAQAGVFMGMYLQSFDNTTYTYTDIEDELYPLDVMTGYGLYSMLSVDNTVTFTGNINFGVEGQAISPGADAFNWNLLGNPYPSGIDWEAVTIPVNMTNEVHYIEAATGNDLSYVQGTGGTGSQYIPPMQGFFVSATGVDNLIFNDAARSHDGGGIYYKDANPLLVVLEAAGENFTDETWIHFNENAGEEHDGQFDAYKRISLSNPELPQLFSYTPGGIMLSVNGMPNVESVAVGFTAVESGVFTINAIETGEFSELYLEDVFNNNKIDLLTSGYTFTYTEGDQQNRFILHFALTGVNDNLANNINIFSYEKDVYVTVSEFTTGDIKIYNIMGQEIVSTSINNTLNKIRLQESAYYVVVVLSNKTVVTEKVFIK